MTVAVHELEEFMASPPDRPSTLARRFDTYEGLRQRAQLYQGVRRRPAAGGF